jgi:hypothetical protein
LKASWCEEPQWLEEAVHELPLQSMVSGKGPVMQVPAGLHTLMCLVMVYVAVKLGTLAGASAAAVPRPGWGRLAAAWCYGRSWRRPRRPR